MLGLIPIHDDNPTRRPAVVTWTLIAVNVVVFLLEPISPLDLSGDANTTTGLCRQFAFFRQYAAIPVELTRNAPLDETAGAPAGPGRCERVPTAYLLLFPRARVTSLIPFLFFIPVWLPAWVVLGSWFVLQWLYVQGAGTAEGAGVAYLAHVVGFVAGAVLVIVLGGLRADRRPPRPPPSYYYPDYR